MKKYCSLLYSKKRGAIMAKRIPLKQQVEARISRYYGQNIFTRQYFSDLGGYDQVGRALLSLTREGKLTRLRYGLYQTVLQDGL